MRDDYAILQFCLSQNVERFSQTAFFELLGSFIERVGGKVKYAPAYTFQDKLSLIRVHHPPRKGTPQQARADLETFVNLPQQFSLWSMLTRGDMFTLTYLVPVGWADEQLLSRSCNILNLLQKQKIDVLKVILKENKNVLDVIS